MRHGSRAPRQERAKGSVWRPWVATSTCLEGMLEDMATAQVRSDAGCLSSFGCLSDRAQVLLGVLLVSLLPHPVLQRG
jgi:hypothetical protein